MLLGIVIHAAQIFSPKHVLPIYNDSTSNVMYYIVEIFCQHSLLYLVFLLLNIE